MTYLFLHLIMHILHLLLFLAPDWLIFCHDYINSHRFSIYFLFLSGEGPTLKSQNVRHYYIRIGSTPTFLFVSERCLRSTLRLFQIICIQLVYCCINVVLSNILVYLHLRLKVFESDWSTNPLNKNKKYSKNYNAEMQIGSAMTLSTPDVQLRTDCSCLDERTDLNNVTRTIMINQQCCSYNSVVPSTALFLALICAERYY